jgi:hypothetical protein
MNHASPSAATDFCNKIGTKRSTFAAQRVRPVSGVLATLPKQAEDNQLAVAATAFMGSRPNSANAVSSAPNQKDGLLVRTAITAASLRVSR